MVVIESMDGVKKDVECVGCALQKGIIKTEGGVLFETKNFEVRHDYEIPIPGFMILATKKHLKGIEDFSKKERKEFIEFLYNLRKAMKNVLKVEYVYLIQEEDSIIKSSHFHLWIFPRYEWMEKFGKGVSSVKPIMEHARRYMKTKENIELVKTSSKKIREYMSRKD